METIQEIAQILRSTDKMAVGFVERVRQMVGSEMPEETVLLAMKRLNPRALDIGKVAVAVKAELGKQRRRSGPAVAVAAPSRPKRVRSESPAGRARQPETPPDGPAHSKTMIDQLGEVLEANWRRAEREGLEPPRMSPPAFVDAVHRNSDPRDATRKRILNACQAAEGRDLLITPTLVADLIREEP